MIERHAKRFRLLELAGQSWEDRVSGGQRYSCRLEKLVRKSGIPNPAMTSSECRCKRQRANLGNRGGLRRSFPRVGKNQADVTDKCQKRCELRVQASREAPEKSLR